MKFNKGIPVYGDSFYRGKCATEMIEQANFYSWLKFNHPEYAMLLIHPKNEGKRTWGQINYERKTGGLPTGASDLIIPASISFVVEVKRKDHTKSSWQDGQQEYLLTAKKLGAFIGIALGADGAKEAFLKWHGIITKNQAQTFPFIITKMMRNG